MKRSKRTKRAEKTAGFLTRRSCRKRSNFQTKAEADVAAVEHNKRILFADMNAYYCHRHQSFHIGHYDKHGLGRVINA